MWLHYRYFFLVWNSPIGIGTQVISASAVVVIPMQRNDGRNSMRNPWMQWLIWLSAFAFLFLRVCSAFVSAILYGRVPQSANRPCRWRKGISVVSNIKSCDDWQTYEIYKAPGHGKYRFVIGFISGYQVHVGIRKSTWGPGFGAHFCRVGLMRWNMKLEGMIDAWGTNHPLTFCQEIWPCNMSQKFNIF